MIHTVMHPNERWACNFELNRYGNIKFDLPPTLTVIANSKKSSMEEALAEKNPDLLYGYVRPYNKDRTDILKKGFSVYNTFLFDNYEDCAKKYNELLRSRITKATVIIDACRARIIENIDT